MSETFDIDKAKLAFEEVKQLAQTRRLTEYDFTQHPDLFDVNSLPVAASTCLTRLTGAIYPNTELGSILGDSSVSTQQLVEERESLDAAIKVGYRLGRVRTLEEDLTSQEFERFLSDFNRVAE